MNKNKKIMTYISIGALVLAFAAIFMGFLGGWKNGIWKDGQWVTDPVTIQFWKIIFNTDKVTTLGFGGESNAGLVVAFVLAILGVLSVGSIVVLNLINKSNKKLNKGLIISSMVILFIVCILMVASKAICLVPDENTSLTTGTTIKNVLAAGPICWAVLSLLSGGAMIAALVFNNKENTDKVKVVKK